MHTKSLTIEVYVVSGYVTLEQLYKIHNIEQSDDKNVFECSLQLEYSRDMFVLYKSSDEITDETEGRIIERVKGICKDAELRFETEFYDRNKAW